MACIVFSFGKKKTLEITRISCDQNVECFFFIDLWFIVMKLLDVKCKERPAGAIVLSQVKKGAQGLNQTDYY